MCKPGFTVPVFDDVANLPVDGSIPLAVYAPQYGLCEDDSANSYFDGSGNQLTGLKQILLFWNGTKGYSALSAHAQVGYKVYKNDSADTNGTPIAVNIPEGWAPLMTPFTGNTTDQTAYHIALHEWHN